MEELNLAQVETQKWLDAVSSPLLHKDLYGKDRVKRWNDQSVIGISTCVQGISRPYASMVVHQCARFSSNTKLIHERAVTRTCRHYSINSVSIRFEGGL